MKLKKIEGEKIFTGVWLESLCCPFEVMTIFSLIGHTNINKKFKTKQNFQIMFWRR